MVLGYDELDWQDVVKGVRELDWQDEVQEDSEQDWEEAVQGDDELDLQDGVQGDNEQQAYHDNEEQVQQEVMLWNDKVADHERGLKDCKHMMMNVQVEVISLVYALEIFGMKILVDSSWEQSSLVPVLRNQQQIVSLNEFLVYRQVLAYHDDYPYEIHGAWYGSPSG